MAETSRRRIRNGRNSLAYQYRVAEQANRWINPYPYMSSVEAKLHVALEEANVPFTWRYFDGDDAPHVRELMPDYAPEFTLKEYRTVIVVLGGYFGGIPGVIDRTALAQALLEADGWTFVALYEQDIWGDLRGTLTKFLPWLKYPPIQGDPRKPPIGTPDFMKKRRQALAAWALRRAQFRLSKQGEATRDRNGTSGRRRRRTPRFQAGRSGNRSGTP